MAWTFDGYTPAEIAEELGLSSATVRGSLRKARNYNPAATWRPAAREGPAGDRRARANRKLGHCAWRSPRPAARFTARSR